MIQFSDPHPIVTKAPNVTKPKRGGRPPIGAAAMTAAERQSRRRAKVKIAAKADAAALATVDP
jgi:hypothetical protein